MASFYRLQIPCDDATRPALERLLGPSSSGPHLDWGWRLEEASPRFVRALPLFLDLLTRHGEALAQLGVVAEEITVWYIYAYEQQCNMEFGPALMKRMGELGVTLCISCYEK